MNEIPVTINVTVEDVLNVSEFLEREDCQEIKNFALKFLESVKKSSEQLSSVICAVERANPYCMGKIYL